MFKTPMILALTAYLVLPLVNPLPNDGGATWRRGQGQGEIQNTKVLNERVLGRPAIRSLTLLSAHPAVNRQLEFAIDVNANYKNPFDPAEVALDAIVTTPTGTTIDMPGFLYQPFKRRVGKMSRLIAYSSTEALRTKAAAAEQSYGKGEILEPAGTAGWRVRFTPMQAGKYRFAFILRDKNGHTQKAGPTLTVAPGNAKGFVRIDPRNARAFRLTTGQSIFPIGANIGWAGEMGTRDYDTWLPHYGKSGANWGRVWLSPSWTTLALEAPHQAGRFDLANAWRLDYVMDEASRNGVRLQLCIDSYNVLRDLINWPEWDRSPYNGVVAHPKDFWTNPEAERRYRAKLRYLVARWGANPNLFAWEFWNEVDGVSDYAAAPVREWHRKMAAYLRSIDPYRHLISTSFGGNGAGAGDAGVFALPQLDFAVSHLYDAPDGPVAVTAAQARMSKLGKPHFVAEFGADAAGSRSEEDPTGMQLHDALWASVADGSSAASMLWWWDSYIEPRNLYPQLASLRKFIGGLDWGLANLRRTEAHIEFKTAPANPQRKDLVFEGGTADWSPSDLNKPKTISIDQGGARGGSVAGFLHGQGNHADLHNPVTFDTNLPWPTVFDVQVGDVSGYGGAALRVTIDGKTVLDEKFEDPDGDRITTTLKKYAGTHPFALSAGKHGIVVENLGQDWVRVDYRFEKALPRTAPPLVAWASAGPSDAIAWVRQEDRTWRNVIERKLNIPPVAPSILVISGLRPGVWKAQLWNTWQGRPLGETTIQVDRKGSARIPLPVISDDLAVKIVRVR